MLQINQCKVKIGYTREEVLAKAASILRCRPEEIRELQIRKESLDARKKPDLFYSLVLHVSVEAEERVLSKCRSRDVSRLEKKSYRFVKTGTKRMEQRPVIIGAGPAGLVCAYYLAREGYRPLLLERGRCVEQRKQDIDRFWESGVLDTTSNVQFGEGGAGTFSDGKLNTLIKDKNGRCHEILALFVKMGAPADIVYKQKPHVGTDLLMDMVKKLRLAIIEMGGEVRFESLVTDFLTEDGQLRGVVVNGEEEIKTDVAVLAIGHSARDTLEVLLGSGVHMEAKAFAVGYRVQHTQSGIDESQYGRQPEETLSQLGAASYKLTAQTKAGRGVYSFCMCPGGYVVNASSEENRCAINGMSYHDRASGTANSAIIVSVTPQDYVGDGPLAGIAFQRTLEERAYALGNGSIPVQRLGDFKKGEVSSAEGSVKPQLKGSYTFANVRDILPASLNEAFLEGMESFGHKIRGFDDDDTLVAGVESRTSSPVRITRDEQACANIKGLYPCGEGAGYAGGITSAAMDGLYIAELIAQKYKS